MNIMKRTVIAVAISSAFVVNANAADLNWNYANINYVSNDIGVSGTGFGIDGSYGVSDNINIYAGYQAPSFLGVTLSELKAGVGYHQPTGNGAWYARGDYRSFDFGGATASGFTASGGMRAALGDKFELDGYIGYASYEGFNGTIFGIDGIYNLSDKFGITAGYMSDKDALGWSGFKIGARMYF